MNTQALSVGNRARKLGEMWSEQSAEDKPPYGQKAAELKEKHELQDIACLAEGQSDARKKGPGRAAGSKKNE